MPGVAMRAMVLASARRSFPAWVSNFGAIIAIGIGAEYGVLMSLAKSATDFNPRCPASSLSLACQGAGRAQIFQAAANWPFLGVKSVGGVPAKVLRIVVSESPVASTMRLTVKAGESSPLVAVVV